MKPLFFYYDPEDEGFQVERTIEAAEKKAKRAIGGYLDGGWAIGVEGVCMGVILKTTECTFSQSRPDDSELDTDGYDSAGYWWGRKDSGDGISGYDDICNYTLESVKLPPEILQMISTEDLVQELKRRDEIEKDVKYE